MQLPDVYLDPWDDASMAMPWEARVEIETICGGIERDGGFALYCHGGRAPALLQSWFLGYGSRACDRSGGGRDGNRNEARRVWTLRSSFPTGCHSPRDSVTVRCHLRSSRWSDHV